MGLFGFSVLTNRASLSCFFFGRGGGHVLIYKGVSLWRPLVISRQLSLFAMAGCRIRLAKRSGSWQINGVPVEDPHICSGRSVALALSVLNLSV